MNANVTAPEKGALTHFQAERQKRTAVYVNAALDAGESRDILGNEELRRHSLKLEVLSLRAAAEVIEHRLQREAPATGRGGEPRPGANKKATP